MEEKKIVKSKRYNIAKIRNGILIAGVICSILSLLLYQSYYRSLFPERYKDIPYLQDILSFFKYPQNLLPYFCVFVGFAIIAFVFYAWASKIEIVITDRRVYGKTVFGKRVDLPLDSISAIGVGMFKKITVSTASGVISFPMIKNRDEIHKVLSDLLIARQEKPASTTTIKQEIPQSNADELKKYKALLDSGVISQAEFDAKKKQLLGL